GTSRCAGRVMSGSDLRAPGHQQPAAEQGQTGRDQQGRQDIAAGCPAPVASDPDDNLEEDGQDNEGDQPGADQPTAAGGQVAAAAHGTQQPPPDPTTDQQHKGPGVGPGLEPVGRVLDQQHQPG